MSIRGMIAISIVVLLAVAYLGRPIVGMFEARATGGERISFVRENGSIQLGSIGPGAPWPGWATRPRDAIVIVKSHYDPAPGFPANGLADVRPAIEPRALAENYMAELERAGWSVESYLHEGPLPSDNEQDAQLCTIVASRTNPSLRSLTLTIVPDHPAELAALRWSETASPPPSGSEAAPC